MQSRLPLCVLITCFTFVGSIRAQSTWIGSSNTSFNLATNWSPSGVPASNADLIFGTSSFSGISLNTLPYTANSLTFSGTNYPHYIFSDSGNTLTIGAGGITLAATGVTSGSSNVDFNSNVQIALGASQTWTTNGPTGGNLTVSSNISGAFAITKAGTGYLALNGTNTFNAPTVSAGTLYLGQTSSAGSGTLTVGGSGSLGPVNSSVTVSNAVTLVSNATVGGSLNNGSDSKIEFSNTVTVPSGTSTMNVAGHEVSFTGTLTAATANANLTVHGTGTAMAILTGTVTNLDTMIADSAGITFGKAATLPAVSVQATNGGYLGIAEIGSGSTPTLATLVGKIANTATFNGTIGFDTAESLGGGPHVFSDTINLTGFTAGNVSLSSSTSAVISGSITLPSGATNYDFKGYGNQGGILVVSSTLANNGGATGVSVTSPNSSGVGSGGMAIVLQGTNTLTGNLSLTQSGAILDSANALPSKNIVIGANAYVGITETATGVGTNQYLNFADLQSHVQPGYVSTSVLGLDSHAVLANLISTGSFTGSVRDVTDTFDLSGMTAVSLGTVTGVTINATSTIKAPTVDGALRLVSFNGEGGNFTINPVLTSGNVTSLVVGTSASDGIVVLNAANTYAGGTTIQGGRVLAGNDSAFGSGNIVVSSTSAINNDTSAAVIGAASGPITLTNNIAVTNFLALGTGKYDDNGNFTAGTTGLTLNGTISNNVTAGRVYFTGPTTINGTNTYTGGTFILASTTVNTDTGLGTNFVDVGYGATLTFTTATPSIGSLSDAGNFINNATTGAVALGSGTLTITGTNSGNFSGVISGTGGLTKLGGTTQTFSGTNTYTGVTTLTGGALAVSTIGNGGVAGNLGAASNAAANLVFDGGTLAYNGTGTATTDRAFTINTGKTAFIAINNGSASLTMPGATAATNGGLTKSGGGTLILSGANLYTGSTLVSAGKLFVNGSLANSAVSVASGATLGGTGSIAGGVNFLSGGHLAPGVSTGTLTFSNGLTLQTGAIFDFQLGTSSDKIFVTGGQLIGPAGTNGITLNLSNSGGYAAGNYTLVDFTNATLNGFDLADFSFGTTIAGFNNSLSFSGNTLVLTATAVPEPATYAALLGALALGSAAWRRRRRASTASR